MAGWVVECRGRMEALARHLVDDPDLADDMVQEAVIAAIESGRADPEHVANVRDPCGWLVGIVRYVALQWLRKVARRSRLLSRNELEIYEMLFPEMEDDSDWDVDRLGQQVLDMGPKQLTHKQLAVVKLILDGKTDAEIAEALNITPTTVRSHRSGSIRRLRVTTQY